MAEKENKTIELWEGYEVEVDLDLVDDFDFICDLDKARREEDIAELITLYFALVGGEKVYEDVKKHLIKETGRFSVTGLREIIDKIDSVFPKAGNRAQKRTWKTTR